jgi:hypothetical protein
MADDFRPQRPAVQSGRMDSMMNEVNDRSGRGSALPWILVALIIVALVVLGVLFRDKLFGGDSGGAQSTQTGRASEYKAVFLTNGQVYFGKMQDEAEQYVTLTDIYYLQVTQPPLQGSQQAGQQQQQQQQPQLSLVKLGQELHGPVDEMKINRDQILFFEDMKEDGRVMQAIREYQKNPPANNQQGTGQQQPTAPVNQTPAQ